jgi:hypothetical protein
MFSKMYLVKYFKYKNKYLKLKGGAIVPNTLPGTQSWFYMPLILAPFRNIRVEFPEEINIASKLACSGIGFHEDECNLDNIIAKIRQYYISHGINLDNHMNLINLNKGPLPIDGNYSYDGHLHINGDDQIKLLDATGTLMYVDTVIPYLVINKSSKEFVYEVI